MKIVGRTDTGYLVQITEDEIGICLGLGPYAQYGETKEAWHAATGLDKDRHIKTGTEINIHVANQYLQTLRENQIKAKGCAEVLRQLADMITTGLPEVLIPPPKTEEPPQ